MNIEHIPTAENQEKEPGTGSGIDSKGKTSGIKPESNEDTIDESNEDPQEDSQSEEISENTDTVSEKKEESKTTSESEAEVVDEEVSDEVEEKKEEIISTQLLNDLTSLDIDQLHSELVRLVTAHDADKLVDGIEEVKKEFDGRLKQVREEAFARYVEETGEKEGFEFKDDIRSVDFYKAYNEFHDIRKKRAREQVLKREQLLDEKKKLVDELRKLVDNQEEAASLNKIRKIQDRWKELGHVSGNTANELWSSYKALLDRFYNNRSILFKLKDLDRKKNLESKIKICERAEQLLEEENINKALEKLNELHIEFKAAGVVPEDQQEIIWSRFKNATEKLYERKKVHVTQFKKELEANVVIKDEIIGQLKEIITEERESIADWKSATDKVLKIQEKWKSSGPAPRSKTKDISKEFWSTCKQFFKDKAAFLSQFEGQKEENLKVKEALCERAEELAEEEGDLRSISNQVKDLQAKWKQAGPVPRKESDAIYQRFKAACDAFFDKVREARGEEEKEYVENLKRKEDVVRKIEELSKSGETDIQYLFSLIDEFEEIGFVPRKDKSSIQDKLKSASDKYIAGIKDLNEEEGEMAAIKVEVASLRGNPKAGQLVFKKKSAIQKKISTLNNDINTWKTNIEFFARSSNAESLRKEVDEKIDAAEKEIKGLKSKLRVLNSL